MSNASYLYGFDLGDFKTMQYLIKRLENYDSGKGAKYKKGGDKRNKRNNL